MSAALWASTATARYIAYPLCFKHSLGDRRRRYGQLGALLSRCSGAGAGGIVVLVLDGGGCPAALEGTTGGRIPHGPR